MMDFDFEVLEKPVRYKLLCTFVAPRPIALVTTVSLQGKTNAAPFSFFNVFSDEPPIVILGIQARPDGTPKDTTKNIKDTGEFVVHLADRSHGQQMVDCAVECAPGVDETLAAGFTLTPSVKVKPGTIEGLPAALECRFENSIEYERRSIVLGRVVHMRVRNDCIDPETLYVRSDVYHPLARLHADNYIAAEDQFEICKPSVEEFHRRLKARKGGCTG